MMSTYTPPSVTKLRALDCMKARARSEVDIAGSRHRECVESMKEARTAYEEQNVSIRMLVGILEEMLTLQKQA